jgi:hypothetical protein
MRRVVTICLLVAGCETVKTTVTANTANYDPQSVYNPNSRAISSSLGSNENSLTIATPRSAAQLINEREGACIGIASKHETDLACLK